MSILAHACLATNRMTPERKALDGRIQCEIREAKRIQKETGCQWVEALCSPGN